MLDIVAMERKAARRRTLFWIVLITGVLGWWYRVELVHGTILLGAYVTHEIIVLTEHLYDAKKFPRWPDFLGDLPKWFAPGLQARWLAYTKDPFLQRTTKGVWECFGLMGAAGWLEATPTEKLMRVNATVTRGAHWMRPAYASRHYRRSTAARVVTYEAVIIALAYNLARRHTDWTRIPQPLARVGNWAELRKLTEPIYMPLGRYIGIPIYLSPKQRREHAIILAPSGKGKTSMYVVVMLLALARTSAESVFTPDNKGELYQLTAGAMSRTHIVRYLAPLDREHSDLYNPLAHIHSKQSAWQMVRAFIDATGGASGEAFWSNLASTLMVAGVMHLIAQPEPQPLQALCELFMLHPAAELAEILSASPSPEARASTRALLMEIAKSDRTMAGVIGEIIPRLDIIALPELFAITSGNTIDFDELVDAPVAVYMAIPGGLAEQYDFLSACFMYQMFEHLIARADATPAKKLPRPFCCVLDEFTNLGTVPNMERYISTLRSREIGVIVIVQGIEQVINKYGNQVAEAILTNAGMHIVLRGAGARDLRRYSERCGEQIVITHSKTTNYQGQVSWSESTTMRPLVEVNELRTLDENQAFILLNDKDPMVVRQRAYYQRWTMRRQSKAAPPPRPILPTLAEPANMVEGSIMPLDDEPPTEAEEFPLP